MPRSGPCSRFARLHPKTYLALSQMIGLLLAIGCAWAFLAIADEVPEKGWMSRLDTATADGLRRHGTALGDSIFSAVSYLGNQALTGILIVVAVVLVYRRRWREVILLIVTCGGGFLLNMGLKIAYHRARPAAAAAFPVDTWSFPSGHAMDALIGYGLLAWWLTSWIPRRRRLIIGVTCGLVALIGYARIYLGVHYLSDVIAGYSAGLLWLMVCIRGYRFARRESVGPSST